MMITLDIPDILAASLGSAVSDVRRAVAEGFAVESYRAGKFSTAEVREFLGHASRWETEDFLSAHGAWPAPAEEEVLSDLANLRALHGK